MYQKDYILRQIEMLAHGIAKMLFNVDTSISVFDPIISEDGALSGSEYLRYTIMTMVEDGKINEAEDFLFETLERHLMPEYFSVAAEFYERLAEMDEQELLSYNFSHEEIVDGLRAVQKMFDAMAQGGEHTP